MARRKDGTVKSSSGSPVRRNRFAACGAAVLFASVFVMASPADARVIGRRATPSGGAPGPAAGATVSVSPTSLAFPTQRAGTYSGVAKTVTVTNTGSVAVQFADIFTPTNDYFGSTNCFAHASLAVGASCTITMYFLPGAVGRAAPTRSTSWTMPRAHRRRSRSVGQRHRGLLPRRRGRVVSRASATRPNAATPRRSH